MKLLLTLVFIILAIAPSARAQAGGSDDATRAQLKQMEDIWAKSFTEKDHGAATVRSMVADDFAGVNSKGEKQTRAEMLEEIRGDTDATSASTNDNMDVHIYAPNLATVIGTSLERGKDKEGRVYNRSYAWTDTWMERGGKWQCIAECVTETTPKR